MHLSENDSDDSDDLPVTELIAREARKRVALLRRGEGLISHNILIKWFEKVNSIFGGLVVNYY